MPLTQDDIRIVQESLPAIRNHLKPASLNFYENLFKIAPELRPMFREDLAGQGMKFFSTLNAIFDMLSDPDASQAEATELAEAHSSLGVKAAHFAPMRKALDITLAETLGPDFTPEIRRAWLNAYDEISAKMIAGAHLP
ncbi:globin domain-containing protein [Amaricoccus macauensis]|uniref:globin domain-containing protein n=1 Tax=Amaricoccus macauensis TaxID=57001 RepID=UPI003C7AEA1C